MQGSPFAGYTFNCAIGTTVCILPFNACILRGKHLCICVPLQELRDDPEYVYSVILHDFIKHLTIHLFFR